MIGRLLGLVFLFAAATFHAPDPAERRQALGPLNDLPPGLPSALLEDSSFSPIPVPGPMDWLASHAEVGQTFEQFVASKPNRPGGGRGVIYLQPIGDFPASDAPSLDFLQKYASAFFGLPVKVQPSISLKGSGARSRQNADTGRQFLTGDLIKMLRGKLPEDAYCRLGVTMVDLYPDPRWNFVFGQASLTERVGVYSFVRYEPGLYGEHPPDARKTALLRSCKVLAHETGHMFGMAHCIHYLCVMNGTNSLGETDSRPLHLCPVCLRKLQWSAGFDAADRYRKLRDLCREGGFEEETRWLDGQLARLKSGGSGR